MLEGKNILLGVCGSIANYKSATLIRLLIKAGANVKIVMTREATNFITPLTLSTLSKNPVFVDSFDAETGVWNNHVDLALWSDLILIAPASANTLAKMANGICDNLLTACYLSAICPVYLAPAMDLDMWKHQSTQQNVIKLVSYGNLLINPTSGELASGLVGEGRMAEPEEIVAYISDRVKKKLPLVSKKALVTAGPTYEAIDPVRFIGNQSSGKMGFAIAEELYNLGADVTLISGPTSEILRNDGIKRIDVISAEEMYQQVHRVFAEQDIIVMSAAVADYRPAATADHKIKKTSLEMTLQLTKTKDILASVGQLKREGQILVGFALETNDEEENAIKKLKNKNLDLIVLNSLNDTGAGFKLNTNKVNLIDKNLNKTIYPVKTKKEVAIDICNKIIALEL